MVADVTAPAAAAPRPEAPTRPARPVLALAPGAIAIGLALAALAQRTGSIQIVELIIVMVWVLCGAIVTLR
ncbi:MAG: hypothetical protein QOG64_552, partial [Acidimicrobiaceae bacterium]|nr:hypothetical protein [Acidimicrobiaceae bacterium]